MTGLRKDHKVGLDKEEGPPTRPVVNGKAGPNCGLANLVSRILRPIRKKVVAESENEVVSTEELLRWIEEFNLDRRRKEAEAGGEEETNRTTRRSLARSCKTMQGEQMVIGSLYVKSLYPSCKAKQMGEHIIQFFKDIDISFQGVNLNAIVKYLALMGFKEKWFG